MCVALGTCQLSLPAKVLDCMCLLSCERAYCMSPSVYLSQHHESVLLASANMSKAGLRASPFWLDRSLCCSWETRQQTEKRKENNLHLLPLLSSLLSHSFSPSSYSTSFSPFHSLLFSSLILLLHCLMLASLTSPTQQ